MTSNTLTELVGSRVPHDKLFTRLRAARLDNTLEAEMRKLARSAPAA